MTYIIAEVGSNWLSFEDCIESIVKAKQSGADAVKFQLFRRLDLFGRGDEVPWSERTQSSTEFFEFRDPEDRYAMPPLWLPLLAEKAKATGIDFMCTGFSPEGYDLIDPLVNRHKIASSEMCHVRILEKVNSFKKPVYLSTGGQTEADIHQALTYLPDCEVTLMYCEASYPAKWIDLDHVMTMILTFHKPIGLSDHTLSVIEIPKAAARHGIDAIEKHFKIRDMATPDSPHSLLPHEFSVMVSSVRRKFKHKLGPTPDETDMVLKHKRRLIATRDIKAGETLLERENFGIYRSLIEDSKAMSPFAVDFVNGKRAEVDILAGHGIALSDLE